MHEVDHVPAALLAGRLAVGYLLQHGRHVAGGGPVVQRGDRTPLAADLLVEQRVFGPERAGYLVDVVGPPDAAYEGVGGDVVRLGHHQDQKVAHCLPGPGLLPLQPSGPCSPVFLLDLDLLGEAELALLHLAVHGHHYRNLYDRGREELFVGPDPVAVVSLEVPHVDPGDSWVVLYPLAHLPERLLHPLAIPLRHAVGNRLGRRELGWPHAGQILPVYLRPAGLGDLGGEDVLGVEVVDEVLRHPGQRDHVVVRVVGLVGADGLLGPPRVAAAPHEDYEVPPLSLGRDAHRGPGIVHLAAVDVLEVLGSHPWKLGGHGHVGRGLGRGLLRVGSRSLLGGWPFGGGIFGVGLGRFAVLPRLRGCPRRLFPPRGGPGAVGEEGAVPGGPGGDERDAGHEHQRGRQEAPDPPALALLAALGEKQLAARKEVQRLFRRFSRARRGLEVPSAIGATLVLRPSRWCCPGPTSRRPAGRWSRSAARRQGGAGCSCRCTRTGSRHGAPCRPWSPSCR